MAGQPPSHLSQSSSNWPAPLAQLEAGRQFLLMVASADGRVVIAPDKDVDGWCSGLIVERTLKLLGKQDVAVFHLSKGENIHQHSVLAKLAQLQPSFVIVTDAGSRSGPLLPGVPSMVIDHHQPEGFPDHAVVVSAASCLPVATSALLAWLLCCPLLQHMGPQLAWLAVLGTAGDLGVQGVCSFPAAGDLQEVLRAQGKGNVSEAVALLNAARRSADCDVQAAWSALCAASSAADIAKNRLPQVQLLHAYRRQIREETDRCARCPPRFSQDGRLAVISINSAAQIHPLIAQRWVGRLKQQDRQGRLHGVMCANRGYIPGKVNFALRRVKSCVNLVGLLQEAAASTSPPALLGADATAFPAADVQTSTGRDEAAAKLNMNIMSGDESSVPQNNPSRSLDRPVSNNSETDSSEHKSTSTQCSPPTLRDALGTEFAKGHPEASGGSVTPEALVQLLQALSFKPQVAYEAAGLQVAAQHQNKRLPDTAMNSSISNDAPSTATSGGVEDSAAAAAAPKGPKQQKLTSYFSKPS